MCRPRKSESTGILGLITDLISLSKKVHTIDDRIQQTNHLQQAAKQIRTPFSNKLKELVKGGNDIVQQPDATDPAVLAQQKQQLDTMTAQFKQTAALVMPLSKQSILFDLHKRSLSNWHDAVKSEYSTVLRNLLIHLGVLAFMLALIVGMAEVWRRAIFRYVHDFRRRYQFMLLRRLVMWFLIAIVVAFAFASELGSLATFAGLLTAGIAVALQNVILSVAGYFYLIGKYGVRVGDRVQISGVTGEVVDIGLVRLHLMELATDRNRCSANRTRRGLLQFRCIPANQWPLQADSRHQLCLAPDHADARARRQLPRSRNSPAECG